MSGLTSPAARNARLGLICVGVFLAMVGLAFASVPFYRAFCQATGWNGAVRRGDATRTAGPGEVSDKTVVVRFDTNVNGLEWRFEPSQASQTVHLGENKLAYFRATNISHKTLTGRALYNVVPETAGPYFSKLECFCFKNQTLAPGQSAEFPVVYYVDKRYGDDRDTRGQTEITLSYTFYPAVPALGSAKAEPTSASAASPLGGRARAGL